MIENRPLQRVRVRMETELNHCGIAYRGRVENVSLTDALVSLDEGSVIPAGDRCTLTLYRHNGHDPVRIEVEMVNPNFTMVDVRFNLADTQAKLFMNELMEQITTQPEPLLDRRSPLSGVESGQLPLVPLHLAEPGAGAQPFCSALT